MKFFKKIVANYFNLVTVSVVSKLIGFVGEGCHHDKKKVYALTHKPWRLAEIFGFFFNSNFSNRVIMVIW